MTPLPNAPAIPPTRLIGLVLGPVIAAIIFFILPAEQRDAAGQLVGGLSNSGRATLAVGGWLAIWWITEAMPIEAAAMLPLALFPIAGVASMKAAAAPYADEVVFLFLGGMLLGAAMERWNLHRRIALLVMLSVGTRPALLVGGLLFATAILSMWVSNTAAAIMMLPIAVGVIRLAHDRHLAAGGAIDPDASAGDSSPARRFAVAAVLAVAYGASIGGVGTLVGTPPNGVLAGFLRTRFDDTLTFGEYFRLGFPVMLVVLPIAWALLLVLHPVRGMKLEGAEQLLRSELRGLGPVSRGEWSVITVAGLASFAWIFREPLAAALGLVRARAGGGKPEVLLTDAGIAIFAAMLLFLIPVGIRRGEFALDWKTASRIPWGVLLLFGGGLSLAAAIEANGVDRYLAGMFQGLAGWPPLAVVLVTAAAAVFFSEIGSNTAVATVMLPVVATAAPVVGVHPYVLCFAVSFGVSLAFMMPSGTPPNALAFTTGHLRVRHMVRAGILLNLACILLITAAVYWLAPVVGLVPAR